MSAFIDTSVLCSLYRVQDNSVEAKRLVNSLNEPIYLSSFVIFEFRQSVRLQMFQHTHHRMQGCSKSLASQMFDLLEQDISDGIIKIVSADWNDVHSLSERLSAKHTPKEGHRIIDVMHVATALHCKAEIFLTLDENQKKLARAEGLKIKS